MVMGSSVHGHSSASPEGRPSRLPVASPRERAGPGRRSGATHRGLAPAPMPPVLDPGSRAGALRRGRGTGARPCVA